jgi:hypothetical protein
MSQVIPVAIGGVVALALAYVLQLLRGRPSRRPEVRPREQEQRTFLSSAPAREPLRPRFAVATTTSEPALLVLSMAGPARAPRRPRVGGLTAPLILDPELREISDIAHGIFDGESDD